MKSATENFKAVAGTKDAVTVASKCCITHSRYVCVCVCVITTGLLLHGDIATQ